MNIYVFVFRILIRLIYVEINLGFRDFSVKTAAVVRCCGQWLRGARFLGGGGGGRVELKSMINI